MLQQLLHILYISLCCLLAGLPVLLLLQHHNLASSWWKGKGVASLCFLFFSGLTTISLLSSWAVLWVPLNLKTFLPLMALFALFAAYQHRRVKELFRSFFQPGRPQLDPAGIVAMASILVLVLVLGTLHPVNEDSKTYYVQLIRWSHEYGTVPGLANIFPRFGLGSNWLNLVGLFKLPFPSSNYTWLNGAAVYWFLLFLLCRSRECFTNDPQHRAGRAMGTFYLLLLLFSVAEWDLARDGAASPNVDFIVSALQIMVLSEVAKDLYLGRGLQEQLNPALIYFCLSVAAFKMSGVFLLLLPLFLLIHFGKLRHWVLSGIAVLLVLAPVLIRNYLTSGYPLFPLLVHFDNPDWQLPAPMASYLHDYIFVTNRHYNAAIDLARIPELAKGNWMADWIAGVPLRQQLGIALALLPAIASLFAWKKIWRNRELGIFFVLLYLLFLAWFLTAPAPRFGFGVIAILLCWVPAYALSRMELKRVTAAALLLFSGGILVYSFSKSSAIREHPSLLLQTEAFISPAGQKIEKGNTAWLIPDIQPGRWMHDCFDAPLPCLPQDNPYLDMRGDALGGGFRMRMPDSAFVRHYVY